MRSWSSSCLVLWTVDIIMREQVQCSKNTNMSRSLSLSVAGRWFGRTSGACLVARQGKLPKLTTSILVVYNSERCDNIMWLCLPRWRPCDTRQEDVSHLISNEPIHSFKTRQREHVLWATTRVTSWSYCRSWIRWTGEESGDLCTTWHVSLQVEYFIFYFCGSLHNV